MRTASTKTPTIMVTVAVLAAGLIAVTPASAASETRKDPLEQALPTQKEVRAITGRKYRSVGYGPFNERATGLCLKRNLLRPVYYPNPKHGFVHRLAWRPNSRSSPNAQTSAVNDAGSVKKAKRSMKRVKQILKDKDKCFGKISEPLVVRQRFRDTDPGFQMTITIHQAGRKNRERTTYHRTGSVVVMQTVSKWGHSDKKWQREAKSARQLAKLTSAKLKGRCS
ncbi:MAG: hypothetical protein K0U64_02280 [Actinomycetia bacterium]|nr:hypothetical protein [Actinomycetes bacterium]